MLSERDTDAFKKWYASATLNHDDGSACYMAWCAALVEERKRAQRDAALKARVEAAEKEVSERGKDVSMLTSYLRHAVMCGDPYGNCWTCTKARELLTRIDAALQAAREA
jgi:hypothetical protein